MAEGTRGQSLNPLPSPPSVTPSSLYPLFHDQQFSM